MNIWIRKAFPFLISYFVYFIRRFDFIKEKQKKTKQKMGVDWSTVRLVVGL